MRTLAIDLETFSSMDLVKAGVYAYTSAPDFEILLFAYAYDDDPVRLVDLASGEPIPQFVLHDLVNESITKTAFNAQFERTCLSRHLNISLSPVSWQCSAVQAAMLGLPLSLEGVAQVLELEQHKLKEGKELIRYFSVPCKATKANGGRTRNLPSNAPDKWELFKSYCIRDVEVERAIRTKIHNYPISEKEQQLYILDQKINDRGVLVDMVLVKQAVACDRIHKNVTYAEAQVLTGIENPNSVAQLKKWLLENGVEVESLSKKAVAALAKESDGGVERLLNLRLQLAKTSIKKYEAIERALCPDGRVRGLLQFYGANRTGRWSSKIIQIQNLPQNHLQDLNLAKDLVKAGCFDELELLFESVPNVLSEIIRTAFVPSKGHRFMVADFSSIEARIIAWLAGEKWRMDVFATHGKIYEASASHMFKVPIEEITKGSPLRQKGKLSELALGYGGSVGALTAMGALEMGLKEEELEPLVKAWRAANPNITKLWWDIDRAAIKAVKEKTPQTVGRIRMEYKSGILFITLPSGRKLSYIKPRMGINKFGREGITYEGIGESKRWCRIDTYGPKLVENCLAGDTLVLTNHGWREIRKVDLDDLLWDGDGWVKHDGVKAKGIKPTINISGVRMTEEHLVLTESGWKDASSCEGYFWAKVKLPNGYKIPWFRWQKIVMGCALRLWQGNSDDSIRFYRRQTKIMWLHKKGPHRVFKHATWNVKTSCICSLALNDRPVPLAIAPSVEKLRGSGNKSLRRMAKEFSKFLVRHAGGIRARAVFRKNRCERELYAGELQMVHGKRAEPKQEKESFCVFTARADDCSRVSRMHRDRIDNIVISNKPRLSKRAFVRSAGRYEQVYDIINCGKNQRFTVLGNSGAFIVHNCVQAIARDLLAEAMLLIDKAGYKIVMHVHDEIIIEAPIGKGSLEEVCSIMSRPPSWAEGLPLSADGFECDFYKKEV